MIHRWFLIAVFGACLLLGIQGPNFVEQYEARVDAHWLEVSANLKGFQEIADRFHGGDILALIRHHQQSPDSTFHAEAEPLEKMVARRDRFAKERDALKGGFPGKALHILVFGDRETTRETYAAYSPRLRLDVQAIGMGLIAAFAASFIFEILLGAGKRVLGLGGRPKEPW
jgi:Protein of unknown function (DUF2937)